MIKVRVVRALRGFWYDLFRVKFDDIQFEYNEVSTTEIMGKKRILLAKMIGWRIFDLLGVYQVGTVEDKVRDVDFSYNRFIHTDRPYILVVENPTAMVHYSARRMFSLMGRIRLKKTFSDENLKAIVCMSEACAGTMSYYYKIPSRVKILQIYPYICDGFEKGSQGMEKKLEQETVNCLFISSDFLLKGGGELLEAIDRNRWYENNKLHLDIITRLDKLSKRQLDAIKSYKNVTLFDFKFSKKELNKFYEKANIFINPTRKDSFSLVTLEALKFGCAFLTTNVYAIKEMVLEDYNGYLINNRYKYWTDDNLINKKVKYHQKNTICKEYIDEKVVDFLTEKLNYLLEDRDKLKKLQENSLELANTKFSGKQIVKQWDELIHDIV